jgi:AraC-like DNA-binding protein
VHIYRYTARLQIDDQWYRITPGTVSVFRPRLRLRYEFEGVSEHVYAHFEADSRDPAWELPAVRAPGAAWRELDRSLREAAGWFGAQPLRSTARVWEILCSLSRPLSAPDQPPEHPVVARAMELIELRMDRAIDISALATELGISHNHLARLLRARTGRSVIGYIRHRRAARAEHLITRTELPLKAIAIQVGLSDLQLFNKTIRRELGRSPSALRRQAT